MNAHCQWFPKLTLPWIDVDQLDEIISWNITKLGDLIYQTLGIERQENIFSLGSFRTMDFRPIYQWTPY